MFYILEQALLRIANAKIFGVFNPASDMFLNLVCLYNSLQSRLSYKRKVLRVLLLKLQCLIRVSMLALEQAER